MKKITGNLLNIFLYTCAASFMTILIMALVLKFKWGIDGERFDQIVAVAQGVNLVDIGVKAEQMREKESTAQISMPEILTRRALEVKHLWLREDALKSGLEQLRYEQQKLSDDRVVLQQIQEQFDMKLNGIQEPAILAGIEDVQTKLAAIKPSQAKDLLVEMIDQGEMDAVVRLLNGMSITKASKIMTEFKTPDEMKQLDEILRKIRTGSPLAPLVAETQAQRGGTGPIE